MSRIGKLPVTVPTGVTVTQNGNTMTVKGPRGELTRSLPEAITVTSVPERFTSQALSGRTYSASGTRPLTE